MLKSILKGLNALWLIFAVILVPSCSPYFNQPLQTSRASLGVAAPGNEDLVNLPDPQQKIVAAVYKFRDQTGQYKPSVNGASWSTAVTQGTTTILLKSLEESGWFLPIERENLGNLLNERKIIRSTRAESEAITGKKEPNLPGLLFAGIILEGGIISYDANVITGGAGLRYFSAGGSGQYREDKVTVYLRAISTSTGEILKTVYTSKTILSQSVDFGVFRYVKFKRLLEAETGFTYNEPSEMAVKEAIDKAVQSLVIEGIQDGYWKLKNKDDMNSEVIQEYFKEREEIQHADVHGQIMRNRRGLIGASVAGGVIHYKGDYSKPDLEPFGEAGIRLSTPNNLAFDLRLGRGKLAATENFELTVNIAEANLNYFVFPKLKYSPYLQVGAGALTTGRKLSDFFNDSAADAVTPFVKAGIGMEYLVTPRLGVDFNASSTYMLNDKLDNVERGRFNDYFWTGKVGINYYFNLYK